MKKKYNGKNYIGNFQEYKSLDEYQKVIKFNDYLIYQIKKRYLVLKIQKTQKTKKKLENIKLNFIETDFY